MAETILIVDDDREFRAELSKVLEEFRTLEAANGRDALEILGKSNEVDLILLDIRMPDIGGTELLRKIRKTDRGLPVIIVTGYSSKENAVEALKCRADDYLEKPLDPAIVRAVVIEHLEQKGARQRDRYVTGQSLVIERVKRFLERNWTKKPTLEEAADIVCLSPKYLSRLFKKSTGKGFVALRLETKLGKARDLLADGAATVDEVSKKLGYRNPESFMRIFKKVTGKTPTEFRRAETAERIEADACEKALAVI
jgi:two-component system, response regulator YesN